VNPVRNISYGKTLGATARAFVLISCFLPFLCSAALPEKSPSTTGEIFGFKVFEEPIVPIGGEPTSEENQALGTALQSFKNRQAVDDTSTITEFLATNRNSAYRASLFANLGLFYKRTGYFSKAEMAWNSAWNLAKNATDPYGVATADRAVSELAQWYAGIGKIAELEALFLEIGDRDIRGPSTIHMDKARRTRWIIQNEPERTKRCGFIALARLARQERINVDFREEILRQAPSENGVSLSQLKALATRSSLDLQMAKRTIGTQVIYPSVVHFNSGHYGTILEEFNGRYLLHDTVLGKEIWVTRAALDAEASGYFLARNGELPSGWQAVANSEGEMVFGKTVNPNDADPGASTTNDKKCPNGDCDPPPDDDDPDSQDYDDPEPMAKYSLMAALLNLHIEDTPVGYSPPRGPSVFFTANYNHREANQPSVFNYCNLGAKWTFNWLSYIEDDATILTNTTIVHYVAGGGSRGHGGAVSFAFVPEVQSGSALKQTSVTPVEYQRTNPDGSIEVYGYDGGGTPRKVFLTKKVDPHGNEAVITWETVSGTNTFRISKITDANGRETTLSYELTDPLKITKVTDPFGRSAVFAYNGTNSSAQITNITDVVGINSSFEYSGGDFISKLTTPYGTTTFSHGEEGVTRWLEATDAFGEKERLEFRENAPGIASTEAAAPTGMTLRNDELQYRNTFFWSKKAMQQSPGVYTNAVIYHWLTDAEGTEMKGVLESKKQPLEARVWYNYPGQTLGHRITDITIARRVSWGGGGGGGSGGKFIIASSPKQEVFMNRPSKIGRVLADATTQLRQYGYNSIGNMTSRVDPLGRTTAFVYGSNKIDLQEIRQNQGSTNDLLASFTYSTNHLIFSATDAAARTTQFGYNSYGQLLASTNALSQVITRSYDSLGNVTNVAGPVAGANVSLTYTSGTNINDHLHRTMTDSEGYTITTYRDILDRVVTNSFPDASTQTFRYNRLDLEEAKDRVGQVTRTFYDYRRKVVGVQDAQGRLTKYEWCSCGALEKIIDPLGRTTEFTHDLQNRLTSKIYQDGTVESYSYEANSSRLKSIKDPKNQFTLFEYFKDNTLKQLSYSNAVVSTPSVSYAYDTDYKRLTSMIDGIGTNSYTYHANNGSLGAGWLATVDGPFSNDTDTYSYDPLGRATNHVIGTGNTNNIILDSLGRVIVVKNNLGSFTNSYLNNTGKLTKMTYPIIGMTMTNSYSTVSTDQRLSEIKYLDSTNAVVSKFNYEYDAHGRITQWTQQTNNATAARFDLAYDRTDQLISATVKNASTEDIIKQYAYSYDQDGNRTSEQINTAPKKAIYNNVNQLTRKEVGGTARFKGTVDEGVTNVSVIITDATNLSTNTATVLENNSTNFTFEAFGNLASGTNNFKVIAVDLNTNNANASTNTYKVVVSPGTAKTYGYDANGNCTFVSNGSSVFSYQWDAADRLVTITNGTKRLDFEYDGAGRRIRQIENQASTTTNVLHWSGTQITEERNSTGGTVTKKYYDQGVLDGSAFRVYTWDHLGSVREMIDNNGLIRARYAYDPWGRSTKVQGNREADFGFTGHYNPRTTWLDDDHLFAMYRVYVPDKGGWLSRDPLGEGSDATLYSYVGNDPINWWDPLGLDSVNLNKPGGVRSLGADFRGLKKGEITVSGHGEEGQAYDYRKGMDKITVEKLAEEIKKAPDYNEKNPVRLYLCEAGKGDNSVAMQLSKLLPNEVFGSTAETHGVIEGVGEGKNARVTRSDEPTPVAGGKWVSFKGGKQVVK
jgi:RHS repeat-associated protein